MLWKFEPRFFASSFVRSFRGHHCFIESYAPQRENFRTEAQTCEHLSPVTLDKSSDTTMHLLFKGYRPVFKRHPLGYEVESLLLLSPQQQMCYHQGNLFGGYAACLLDRILADCCNSTSSNPAFTAYLNTSFRRPVPPKAQVRLRAWPVKIDRRKIYLEGSLDIIGTCGQWIEAISADALFVTPRKEIL